MSVATTHYRPLNTHIYDLSVLHLVSTCRLHQRSWTLGCVTDIPSTRICRSLLFSSHLLYSRFFRDCLCPSLSCRRHHIYLPYQNWTQNTEIKQCTQKYGRLPEKLQLNEVAAYCHRLHFLLPMDHFGNLYSPRMVSSLRPKSQTLVWDQMFGLRPH